MIGFIMIIIYFIMVGIIIIIIMALMMMIIHYCYGYDGYYYDFLVVDMVLLIL
jgi:hypothetical protein